MSEEHEFAVLASLGLSARAIESYVALLVNDDPVPDDAAAELESWRLIDRSGERVAPRSVNSAVAEWLRQRASQDHEVRSAAARLDALLDQYGGRTQAGFLTYVRGERDLTAAYDALVEGARERVDEFIRGPFYEPESLAISETQEPTAQRGVHYRVVYDAALLQVPQILELIRESAALGEESRSYGSLPMRMAIADGEDALIVLPTVIVGEGGAEEAIGIDGLLVRRSPLTDALGRIFDQVWASAVSVSEALHTDDVDDAQILRLLAQGLTDQAIGQMLGISVRTVQRRVSAIATSIGVSGRFQLGAEAQRRGMLG